MNSRKSPSMSTNSNPDLHVVGPHVGSRHPQAYPQYISAPHLHSISTISQPHLQHPQQSSYQRPQHTQNPSHYMHLNMGPQMSMSGLDASLRYPQAPQQLQNTSQLAAPSSSTQMDGIWRPHPPMESSQYKQNNIDLDYDQLFGSNMNDPSRGSSENSMNSYEINAFNDVMSSNTSSSTSGPNSGANNMNNPKMGIYPQNMLQYPPRGRTMSAMTPPPQHIHTRTRASTVPTPKSPHISSMSSMSSSSSLSSTTTSQYHMSGQINSDQESIPDLSQQKLTGKNERCQFHNCPNRARVSQIYGKFCNRHVIVAPCGFPGCRDRVTQFEGGPEASLCDKHLHQGKDALHDILANRAQNVPVCRHFGCFKNDQGRGYCRGHEKLLMAIGRLPKHINKRRLNSSYTMCSYPECKKHSQRNHLCRTHGNEIQKQAESLAKVSNGESFDEILTRLQKDIRRCTHPNCTKNSQRDRLCTMHYFEKHNGQSDRLSVQGIGSNHQLSDTTDREQTNTTQCNLPECSLPSVAHGMCRFHAGDRTKLEPSTDPNAVNATNSNGPSPFTQMRPTLPMQQSVHMNQDMNTGSNTMFYPNVPGSSPLQQRPSGFTGPLDSQIPENGRYNMSTGTTNRVANLSLNSSSSLNEMEAKQALYSLSSNNNASTQGNDRSNEGWKASGILKTCEYEGCGAPALRRIGFCSKHDDGDGNKSSGQDHPMSGNDTPTSPDHEPSPRVSETRSTCLLKGCGLTRMYQSPFCTNHCQTMLCRDSSCTNFIPNNGLYCREHATNEYCGMRNCGNVRINALDVCKGHENEPRCKHPYCGKLAVQSTKNQEYTCQFHTDCRVVPCKLCAYMENESNGSKKSPSNMKTINNWTMENQMKHGSTRAN